MHSESRETDTETGRSGENSESEIEAGDGGSNRKQSGVYG